MTYEHDPMELQEWPGGYVALDRTLFRVSRLPVLIDSLKHFHGRATQTSKTWLGIPPVLPVDGPDGVR